MSIFDFESGKSSRNNKGAKLPDFPSDHEDVRVKVQAIEWLDNQMRLRISEDTGAALTCLYACQAMIDVVLDYTILSVVPEYGSFSEGERAVFKNAMVLSTMAMSKDSMTSHRMADEVASIIESTLMNYAKDPNVVKILSERIDFFRNVRNRKEGQ